MHLTIKTICGLISLGLLHQIALASPVVQTVLKEKSDNLELIIQGNTCRFNRVSFTKSFSQGSRAQYWSIVEGGIWDTSNSSGDVVVVSQDKNEVILNIPIREEPYDQYAEETFLLHLANNQVMVFSEYLEVDLAGPGCDNVRKNLKVIPLSHRKAYIKSQWLCPSCVWDSQRDKRPGAYIRIHGDNEVLQGEDNQSERLTFSPFDSRIHASVAKQIREEFITALNTLARLLQIPLADSVHVNVALNPSGNNGSVSGMVSRNEITILLHGDMWTSPVSLLDPSVSERLRHVMLHEASHLWNNNTSSYYYPNSREENFKLHEGFADFVAYHAAIQLGWRDVISFRKIVEKDFRACQDAYLDRPSSHRTEALWYRCGTMINLALESYLERHRSSLSMTDIWGFVFRQADRAGGRYDNMLFIKMAEKMMRLQGLHPQLKEIFNGQEIAKRNAIQVLNLFLDEKGLNVSPRALPAGDYIVQMMWSLMMGECGFVDFQPDEKLQSIEVFANQQSCATFGQKIVTHIEGKSFGKQAELRDTFTVFRKKCLHNGKVKFLTRDNPQEQMITCRDTPPPLDAEIVSIGNEYIQRMFERLKRPMTFHSKYHE